MASTTLRTAMISLAAIPLLLITDIGTAHAYPAPAVEGGRGRIQITAIPSPDLHSCRAQLDGGAISQPFGGAGQPASTLFQNVPPGTHTVDTLCYNTAMVPQIFTAPPVAVAAPNPVLDTVDNALAGVGSSAMVTDSTLR